MFRGKEGFTLVELLIVLAVIAALLATITPIAVGAVRKAKISKVAANLRNLAAAVQSCLAMNEGATSSCNDKDTELVGKYINTDPGSEYGVAASGSDYLVVYFDSDDPKCEKINEVYKEATNTTCKDGASGKKCCVAVRAAW